MGKMRQSSETDQDQQDHYIYTINNTLYDFDLFDLYPFLEIAKFGWFTHTIKICFSTKDVEIKLKNLFQQSQNQRIIHTKL
jgi:hypothetical protein